MKKNIALIALCILWMGLIIISYFYFDIFVMKRIYALHLSAGNGSILWWLTNFGNGLYVILAVFLAGVISLMFIRHRVAIIGSIYLFVSVILTSLFCDVLKFILGRYRPSLYYDSGRKLYGFSFDVFSRHHWSRYESFPSGHTTIASALAIGIFLLLPKWRVPAIFYMVMIASTRVLRLDHYVSDVMAGMCLGAIGSFVLYRIFYQRLIQSQFLLNVKWIKQ